ncbi:uncharacterized protein LOC555931 [Danio rerio]|uniref:Uncharacterized protein LOC555931 n=1 Tax=Danio rerio TaxID=7955 RepID=A0A0R4ICY6_DANRE|nr:uncharacterized protein LOC555931 [Danio rerio]|eukprot:NP_001104623.2 SLAM family member [Danio rerio]
MWIFFQRMFVERFRRLIDNGFFFCLCLLIANGVFGADTDEVKSVSVMEGDSVLLNTDVTDVKRDYQILWMFGPHESRIAEIYKQNIDFYDSNGTYGDRLKMDNKTGSLTITKIRIVHSGLYKLNIISSGGSSYLRFSVAVYARLPTPLITEKSTSVQNPSSSSSSVPKCVLNCSVLNVSNASLSWYKGNSLFSSIEVSDLNNSIYLHLECLDDSYSCVVAYSFTNQTTHLNNTQHCQTCSGAVQRSHIILPSAFAVFLALVCAVLLCCHRRKCKQMGKANIQEEEMDYAEPIFCTQRLQNTDVITEDHTVYSSIRT